MRIIIVAFFLSSFALAADPQKPEVLYNCGAALKDKSNSEIKSVKEGMLILPTADKSGNFVFSNKMLRYCVFSKPASPIPEHMWLYYFNLMFQDSRIYDALKSQEDQYIIWASPKDPLPAPGTCSAVPASRINELFNLLANSVSSLDKKYAGFSKPPPISEYREILKACGAIDEEKIRSAVRAQSAEFDKIELKKIRPGQQSGSPSI